MELRAGLTLDDDFVVAFAAAHGVRRIALYGSALREDFRSDSDIEIDLSAAQGAGLAAVS
jgi:predicted nucleotidyltransferase